MRAKKSSELSCAIWWVRRDLRLVDNQALQTALEESGQVVPVFILDPNLFASAYVGEKRLAFLLDGLRALDTSLRQKGSYLVVRQGDPLVELKQLASECAAGAIYAEPDVSPYAMHRDERASKEIPMHWSGSPAVLPPGFVLNKFGRPFTVFTPFSKAWRRALPLQPEMRFTAPPHIPTPAGITGIPVPAAPVLPEGVPFPAGEDEAVRRLQQFTGLTRSEGFIGVPQICDYALGRDRLSEEGTSRLSPYLRFGMLSARQAVVAAISAIAGAPDEVGRQAAETWLNELVWREFYLQVLYHFPYVRQRNFRSGEVRWVNNPEHFEAWKAGRTGYPLVDAAMRQLVQSGWMHNRGRMVTASFLTKDLLIDWRWGEGWFMQHLVDGDPALNNGGWQWTAGTGTDAVPYFRILNPVSQSQKHDPQGVYIRHWLPELRDVPDEFIHQPWLMSREIQKASGVKIGVDYPAPLVEHAERRELALQAYRRTN